MRMHTGKLVPNNAQNLGTLGYLNAHEAFDGLGIAERMAHRADTADAFRNIDELVVIARFHEFLQPAVNETDLRNGLQNVFILNDEVEMQRLGKNGMLRTEGDDH